MFSDIRTFALWVRTGHSEGGCRRLLPLKADMVQHDSDPLCARSGHSSVRFVIFIPSDADYDGRRADWIFERKKLKPRGDYV
jgi:hypothetical protein